MKIAASLMLVSTLVFPGSHSEKKFSGDIAAMVSVKDLLAESTAKLGYLEEKLSNQASYKENRKKTIQAAGVMACLGQALSLHKEGSNSGISGIALRETALEFAKSKSFDEAKKAYGKLQTVLQGKSKVETAPKREWKDLIDLHSLMKEVNTRNGRLRRVVRRSRKPETDSLHASTLAVLALAIHNITHEVKNKADLPIWQGYAVDLQKSMTELSAAIKKKDAASVKKIYLKATKSCRQCHEKFRKDED